MIGTRQRVQWLHNTDRYFEANMLVNASLCHSGISASPDFSNLCRITNILAPVLSITTNISVMFLVLWKAWWVSVRDTLGSAII